MGPGWPVPKGRLFGTDICRPKTAYVLDISRIFPRPEASRPILAPCQKKCLPGRDAASPGWVLGPRPAPGRASHPRPGVPNLCAPCSPDPGHASSWLGAVGPLGANQGPRPGLGAHWDPGQDPSREPGVHGTPGRSEGVRSRPGRSVSRAGSGWEAGVPRCQEKEGKTGRSQP